MIQSIEYLFNNSWKYGNSKLKKDENFIYNISIFNEKKLIIKTVPDLFRFTNFFRIIIKKK